MSSDIFLHDRASGVTKRVSVGTHGQANGASGSATISASGRYVAFESAASNLVARDTNRKVDVFVRDLATGKTSRVSVSSRGVQAGCKVWCESTQPSLSTDGRYVAFESSATNLVRGDTNKLADVFVRDRRTGRTERVSVTSKGKQAGADHTNNGSNAPSISGDGRYVAFHSADSNLVPGDTNRTFDVFVHDRKTGRTTRISVSSAGPQANGENVGAPSFSADGRYVAFNSLATNLVPGDTKDNDILDVFVRDLRAGTTTIASLGSAGQHGGDSSAVSGDRVQQRRPACSPSPRSPRTSSRATRTARLTPSCATSRRETRPPASKGSSSEDAARIRRDARAGRARLRAGRLRVGERSLPRQARLGRGDHHRARADRHGDVEPLARGLVLARQRARRRPPDARADAARRDRGDQRAARGADGGGALDRPRRAPCPPGRGCSGSRSTTALATVDLTSEFQYGAGALSMQTRLGQVVYTLTQFPTVQKVRFRLDGDPGQRLLERGHRARPPGRPQRLLRPAACDHRRQARFATHVTSPVTVAGTANVFEANVSVEVLDANGDVVGKTFTTASCGTGCRGTYSVPVSFKVAKAQSGTIVVHDDDAAGTGKPPHEVRVPVTLAP